MDKSTFHMEINKIVAEHRLDQHSFVKSVNQGKAAREQLKGYPIQHYETDKEHGEGGHRMIDRPLSRGPGGKKSFSRRRERSRSFSGRVSTR